MIEAHVPETSFDQLTERYAAGVDRIHQYFADKSAEDVMQDMPSAKKVSIDDSRQVQTLELVPEGDFDETRTIVLGLPFLNGLEPHLVMRAKALQLMVNPEVPMVVLPNNSRKNNAYSLTDKDREQLSAGNIKPIGEMGIQVLEKLNHKRNLGALMLSGYSQGGLTVLSMGAVGSYELNVTAINADEPPSKLGRNAKRLQADFTSGGFDYVKEAHESGVDALDEVMRKHRLARDSALFLIQALRNDSKLITHAMTGSAQPLVVQAASSGVPIKLGRAGKSPIFDPASIMLTDENVRLSVYGEGFERGHAVGDNIIKHALMAADGLIG